MYDIFEAVITADLELKDFIGKVVFKYLNSIFQGCGKSIAEIIHTIMENHYKVMPAAIRHS